MTLTRCNNGHFYDEDKFTQCPHCANAGRNSGATVPLDRNVNVTVPLTDYGGGGDDTPTSKPPQDVGSGSLSDVVNRANIGVTPVPSDNESKTVSFYSNAIGTEPVVGWLVCIEGNHMGEGFTLKSGRNFIGRATGMDVVLSGDSTVSREKHAIVLYDPEYHKFLVQPGDARELCYMNDQLVLNSVEIGVNDIIKVGATRLMFVPFCTNVFNWSMVKKNEEAMN